MDRLPWEKKQPFFEALNLEFTSAQLDFVKDSNRFPVVIGGERGGKSYVGAAELLPHILMLPYEKPEKFTKRLRDPMRKVLRKPDFVIFAPHYREAKWEFDYLEELLEKAGELVTSGPNKVSKAQDKEWKMVTKKGVVITTFSLQEGSAVRAMDLEAGLVAEAGNCEWDGVERVRGRVSGTRGFIIYSGTLENSQKWYRDRAMAGKRPNNRGYKTFSLPTWSNHHLFPGGRQDPEILSMEEEYDEDTFAMRVAAEPRPPRDRVIPEAQYLHVRDDVKVPDDARWEIWIDPGYAEAHAVLFVAHWEVEDKRGRRRRVFYVADELYEQQLHTREMAELAKNHPRWKNVQATNAQWRLGGIIDIASKGHRDATDSALEVWTEETGLLFDMEYWHEDVLLERLRSSFKNKTILIHSNCEGLLAELGLGEPVFSNMHHWKFRTDRRVRVQGEKPLDRWNHSSKALGYGILYHIGAVERTASPQSVNRLAKNTPAASYLRRKNR